LEFQFAADFRIGESVAVLRGGFENIQGALDGGCRLVSVAAIAFSGSTK